MAASSTYPPAARCSVLACTAALAATLAGCSTLENFLSGDKIDYKSSSTRTSSLEVPPDLSQLARDTRYQPSSGSVTASTFQTLPTLATAAAATPAVVAPKSIGAFSIERLGNERWLRTTQPPEEVYPMVRAFWRDNGFAIVQDRADAGVLETDWAQNRAKLPQDFIRSTIGRFFEAAFSTGELDKFRTRVERNGAGSDVYITHRGMVEIYTGQNRDNTSWQPRPADPQLEAEFLSRLMVKLGAREEQAVSAVTASTRPAAATPPRARMVDARPGPTLQVDDGFDRAWRRVGIALDRSGFTVEDRDRAQGTYFVRYVDPAFAGREEPGILSRMFNTVRGKRGSDDAGSPIKYRVKVTGESTASSSVAVLDSQGRPETGEAGRRIAGLLLDDLK